MSDERLIRALRALDRPVEVDPAFGEALYAVLEGELLRRRRSRPRLTLLLVAALLLALAVGGVVAVGSGLLRLPWPNDRSLIPPGAVGCPASLPAGQLLELVVAEEGLADPGDEWGPTAGFVVRIYDDGLLLTGGHGRTVAQVLAGESGITARRLSPLGVESILKAADDALGSGCHDRWADIPPRTLSVREADAGASGEASGTAWGYSSTFIREMTDQEEEAAEGLVDRLRDPGLWLPVEAWVDATTRPYVPDRWLVNLQFPETNADPEGALGRQLPLPIAEDMTLPGGTALLALGDSYREPDGAKAPGQPGIRGRCTVVPAASARSFAEAFADAGAVAFNQQWWFRYESGALGVAIRPLLPTDGGCTARSLGLYEHAGPSPSLPPPSGDLATVDPCAFLSEAKVRTAMQVPAAEPVVINDRWSPAPGQGRFGAGYRVCSYRLGGTPDHLWDHPKVLVHARTSSTGLSEARRHAHEILGEDAVEEVVLERTVWRNGCEMDGSTCGPAVAISVEPYFIVLTFEGQRSGDLPSMARALASAITTDR